MTQVPPSTEPPAADTLDAASQAAADRIANAGALEDNAGGDDPPIEPEGTPAADVLGEDDPLAGLDLSNLSYRDGAKLAADIGKARDRFKPFADAFGGMDDDQRQALLDAAPNLGADLSLLAAKAGGLHADDRRWFAQVMELMATDPEQAAELLEWGTKQIRSALNPDDAAADAPPAGEAPAPADGDDPDRPLTMRDLEAMQAAQREQEQLRALEQQVRDDAIARGYDPAATEGPAAMLTNAYLNELARTGDPDKAHEGVEAWKQSLIDDFVKGKSADADRPAPTADAQGAPAPQGAPLETLEDADAAMRSRFDGAFGPDPRRRGDA